MEPGDAIELDVTPDPYLTVRYAGASGDFNPIHIDESFAQQVGLPGRILHGLWMMAQVARATTEAAGGPQTLARLSVQFRGMGMLGEEMTVKGAVTEREGDRVTIAAEMWQGERRVIKGARAEVVPTASASRQSP